MGEQDSPNYVLNKFLQLIDPQVLKNKEPYLFKSFIRGYKHGNESSGLLTFLA